MGKRATSANAGKAATSRASKSTVSRVLTYAPPWAAWILVLPLSAVAYVTWGRNPAAAPWMSMAAFALVAALVPFSWRVLRSRDEVLQWMGTVSAGLGGFWFIVGMLVGPLTRGVIDAWAFGGFGICVFWTIRRMVVNGAAEQQAEPQESKLDKVLAGAKVFKPKEIEGRVVAQMEVNRGEQTVRDLQGSADKMAGALGVRPGAVRIAADPKDAGRAELVIVPNDPLERGAPWPGPSNPGGSIHDPLPAGIYEDGELGQLWLSGDDAAGRALAHWLIMGMTRAGKSQGWTMLMADALTRRDVVVWASDHVKGSQTLRPIEPALDWVVKTQKGGKEMIAATRDVVRARADYLGENDFDQWTPDCGLPLLVVWLEEAVELVSDSTSFVRLVQQAGSTGVVVVVSLQRASHDNIDTSARAQLAGTLCFGVRDGQDASFALDDGVLDAGAAPDLWQNRMPGYCYLVAPGVPEDRWAVPMRTFRASREQVAASVAEWSHVRAELDALSRDAAGAAYARREVVVPASDLVGAGLEGEVVDREDMDADDGEDGMEPIPPTLEPDLRIDADQPITPPTEQQNLAFTTNAGPKLSMEQAQAVVQQHLRTLLEQGQTHTQPADVCKMKPATTRSREWVRKELDRLCTAAGPGEIALERDVADMPGMFRIVAPALSGAR